MASIVGNNAVGWAQFELNGGWKNTLGVVGAYAVIVGGLVAVTASLDPRQTSTILSGWTKGLLGLQMGILTIYGSIRIITGIRRDVTGQMIESHRLMPVPPLHAVAGYIFGAASQAVCLAVVNFLIGAVTTPAAGLPLNYWVKANLVVATFSVFIWTVVAVAAMSARGALFWVVGPMVAFYLSGGALSLLLPGIAILTTPTQGNSVFDARQGSDNLAAYAVPMLCQAAIAIVCVAAAMRKYRRSEAAAFGPLLALSLLAAVVLTSTVGILLFDDIATRYLYGEGDAGVQVVASTVAVMCFMTGVMCSVAWADALARRAAGRRVGPRVRSLPPILGVVLAAAIASTISIVIRDDDWDYRTFVSYSLGILLVHGLAICYLARWVYARVDRAAIIVIIWLALTWLAPLIVDLVLRTIAESDSGMGTLAAWSPIGCLIAVIKPEDADARVGLIAQFVLALIPILLYHIERAREKRRSAAQLA